MIGLMSFVACCLILSPNQACGFLSPGHIKQGLALATDTGVLSVHVLLEDWDFH